MFVVVEGKFALLTEGVTAFVKLSLLIKAIFAIIFQFVIILFISILNTKPQ
jgi:hypothetical protein